MLGAEIEQQYSLYFLLFKAVKAIERRRRGGKDSEGGREHGDVSRQDPDARAKPRLCKDLSLFVQTASLTGESHL